LIGRKQGLQRKEKTSICQACHWPGQSTWLSPGYAVG